MPNFRKYEQKNVQLLVNTPTTANVMLEVGIGVADRGSFRASCHAEHDGRDPWQRLRRKPGEEPAAGRPQRARLAELAGRRGVHRKSHATSIATLDTRSGAVNGARSDQSNITLDGVDVNDQIKGSAFTSVLPVTLDSVQEFRVTTTNATPTRAVRRARRSRW